MIAGLCTSVLAGPGNPCGVFAIGSHKIDLAKGEKSTAITSRDALIDAVQTGFSFNGSGDCKGAYEIVDMKLRIATAKEDVNYDYAFDMISKMQSMEDYMLTRYFVDAKTLYFTNITVKNASGETMQIADVQFDLQ